MKTIPQLQTLLDRVETAYGRPVHTSAGFEALSVDIERKVGDTLSASSLKRFWGYVSVHTAPRISSLNILARYIGFHDFNAFCKQLRKEDGSSGFFETECLSVSELHPGARLQLGWAPDRMVTLVYLGRFLFEVRESCHAKLRVGDRFEVSDLLLGCPLYAGRILRDGKYTPPYVAAAVGGLTSLKILPSEE